MTGGGVYEGWAATGGGAIAGGWLTTGGGANEGWATATGETCTHSVAPPMKVWD
jgi:hypothetical protein